MTPTTFISPFKRASYYFVALLILAFTAFWQPYFSALLGRGSISVAEISAYKHFHVIMAVLWLLLLIVQPSLIRFKRFKWHRRLGRSSYLLAPLLFLSIVLLAHSQVVTLEEQMNARRNFILFIQLGFALFFAVLYGLAILNRHKPAIHSRFMLCTGILLIEPILVRVFKFNLSFIEWSVPYQVVTWPMVDLLLLALVIADRRNQEACRVFQWSLTVFVVFQVVHFTVTDTEPWIAFTSWFASLSLT